jgi:hypothetical protein
MKQHGKIKMTLDKLAVMVANGFSEQEHNITGKIAGKIAESEARISQQIAGINNRIDDLALNRATREEVLVLDKRISRVEAKLGLDFKHQTRV